MISRWLFLPLLVLISLVIYEEKVSIPTCHIVSDDPRHSPTPTDADVNVMMVADLTLLGSEAGYMNLFFRDSYMAKFFRKALAKLKPDMLVVLGDVSANGWKSTNEQWLAVLHQFQNMLGPFLGIPLHIVIGEKDVGGCSQMGNKLVARVANSLPGLESDASGSFTIKNVSFVSLNAIAMVCDQHVLHFSVEKIIERESLELEQERYQEEEHNGFREWAEDPEGTSGELDFDHEEQYFWKKSTIEAGAGPVVLVHLPLFRSDDSICRNIDIPKCNPWHKLSHSCQKTWASADLQILKLRQYHQAIDVISHNATEYLLRALKPRIVFSAHTHRFCDRTHYDGTREITIPTMTWNMRDDPSFIIATFGRNNVVTIQQCFLVRESQVLMVYVLVLTLLLVVPIMIIWVDSSSFSYESS